MNPAPKPSLSASLARFLLALLVMVLLGVVFKMMAPPAAQPKQQPGAQAQPAVTVAYPPLLTAASNVVKSSAATAVVSPNSPNFQERPFAVVKETATHQWTAENGRDTNVIRRLAHNALEYQRMLDESARIFRRQLVYRKEPITATIDRARNAGEPVRSFTLPGLDGQEYTVEVTQNSVERTRMAGSLSGHLKGQINSIVSLGFADGYESFNIFSPDDKIYIVADAREPGEVMVKEIDPDKYGVSPQTGQPDFIPTR